jgi:hypothetical protein
MIEFILILEILEKLNKVNFFFFGIVIRIYLCNLNNFFDKKYFFEIIFENKNKNILINY